MSDLQPRGIDQVCAAGEDPHPSAILDSLDSAIAGAFTAAASSYGDLLFLASRSSDFISAIRPDASKFELMRGPGATPDLTVSPIGELLTIDTVNGYYCGSL